MSTSRVGVSLMACVAAISVGFSGVASAIPGPGYNPNDRLNEWSAGIPASPGLQQWAKESGFVGATVPKPDKADYGTMAVAEFGSGCIVLLNDGNYLDPSQPTVVVMNRYNTAEDVRIGGHPNGLVRLRYSVSSSYIRDALSQGGYTAACA